MITEAQKKQLEYNDRAIENYHTRENIRKSELSKEYDEVMTNRQRYFDWCYNTSEVVKTKFDTPKHLEEWVVWTYFDK